MMGVVGWGGGVQSVQVRQDNPPFSSDIHILFAINHHGTSCKMQRVAAEVFAAHEQQLSSCDWLLKPHKEAAVVEAGADSSLAPP
ncbi:hypothetical protein Taro_037654 [Colocasia esculenta]|uniref:Uncharacterized protein n=1 Tax=Colocasia esculenta TaxID=4460 RepID=A0A843WBN6_COLES|nr:hypothetical protein [Colocasia esculenta]